MEGHHWDCIPFVHLGEVPLYGRLKMQCLYYGMRPQLIACLEEGSTVYGKIKNAAFVGEQT